MNIDCTIGRQKSLRMETTPPSSLESEDESTGFVRWQSSQTTCSALNQLIHSSENEQNSTQTAEKASTSRGWQREASFDQIPGFSLLSTNDSQPQLSSQPSSSSSRPIHYRPRPSLARPRSPSIAPEVTTLPIPFLDKSNPSSFLDMLKGVSARLDEKVGVKLGGSATQSSTVRVSKRLRGATADLQAGRPKRSRASVPSNLPEDLVRLVDKGKRRAVSALESRPNYANDDCGSVPELPFPLRPTTTQPKQITRDDDLSSNRPANASFFQPSRDSGPPGSLKNPSQAKMPPPPAPPPKHPTKNPSSTATMNAHVLPMNSTQNPRINIRPQPTAADVKTNKLDSVPRYHPLLLEQQTKKSNSSTSVPLSNVVEAQTHTALAGASATTYIKARTSVLEIAPSSTPKPPSSQSSRPPALGMRRTHTLPGPGIATALKPTGTLPTKQKAFKPPLLSQSMPASQATLLSQQAKQPPSRLTQSHSYDNVVQAGPTGSNGSTSSDSLPSSGSSYTRHTTSSSSCSSSVSPLAKTSPPAGKKPAQASTSSASKDIPADSETSLSEPLDGDGDSSFGDISFDLDALEETMRMYD